MTGCTCKKRPSGDFQRGEREDGEGRCQFQYQPPGVYPLGPSLASRRRLQNTLLLIYSGVANSEQDSLHLCLDRPWSVSYWPDAPNVGFQAIQWSGKRVKVSIIYPSPTPVTSVLGEAPVQHPPCRSSPGVSGVGRRPSSPISQ